MTFQLFLTVMLVSLTAAFESVGTMLTNMDTPQKEDEAKVSGQRPGTFQGVSKTRFTFLSQNFRFLL